MTLEHTQQQSSEEAQRAQQLSRQNSRPPAELPGYDAERLLGRGAYGEVWVATDRNTSRRVAIKFYTHRGGVDWNLLSREVEKLAYLFADRYVVQLLEVGWSAVPPYYVMEYVENGSLDDYLRRQGPLSVPEAVELFRELAVGLNHAHGKGVLHCDLKPANILLDQDHKPRLADFGQSRLSHEQTPALGTLFYMAPEQADLEAVPDARWDVYALGAILYRMLTGEPPSRSATGMREIEQAVDLPDRLARYRQLLSRGPAPSQHRRVRGVDRALAEVIDRCLILDPERRFANVQEILDALASRAEARTRRPLVLLGFVGPLLLLAIMALFGMRGYEHALQDSEHAIRLRARESNEFAAKFAARSIEGEIAKYFSLIRQEADHPEFQRRLIRVAESPIVQQLHATHRSPAENVPLREQFIEDPVRKELNDYLQERLQAYLDRSQVDSREVKLSSILVLDARGRMVAVAYDTEVNTRSVGWSYAYRSYFHGGTADLPRDTPVEEISPLTQTRLSAAFRSSSTGIWKVGVSAPIYDPTDKDRIRGVVALTVSLGDFAYFRSNNRPDHFAVLIDGRAGANFGTILQHPLLDRLNEEDDSRPQDFTDPRFRLSEDQLQQLKSDRTFLYHDPLARAAGGEAFRGEWIGAVEEVRMPTGRPESDDMIVLLQERYEEATRPVKQLGTRLKEEGLWALFGVAGVILVLWYTVLRILTERKRTVQAIRRPPSTASSSQSTVAGHSQKGP